MHGYFVNDHLFVLSLSLPTNLDSYRKGVLPASIEGIKLSGRAFNSQTLRYESKLTGRGGIGFYLILLEQSKLQTTTFSMVSFLAPG